MKTLFITTIIGFAILNTNAGPEVTARSEWKAEPARAAVAGQYKPIGKIRFVSIHHTQSYKIKTGTSEAQLLRNVQGGHLYRKSPTRPWPILEDENGTPVPHFGDIAYHYLIGGSGAIYEGRDPKIAPASYRHYYSDKELKDASYDSETGAVTPKGSTATTKPGAAEGHLTVSFICGKPNDELLDPEVMKKAAKFIAELLYKNNLKPADIRLHREVANTKCPGDKLYQWIRGTHHNPASLDGDGGKLIIKYFKQLASAK